MDTYKVVNLSGSLTIEAEDLIEAAVTVTCLSSRCVLKDSQGAIIIRQGEINDEWLREHGIESLSDYFKNHGLNMAKICNSYLYCNLDDRRTLNRVLHQICPEDQASFRKAWNEKYRGNDIGDSLEMLSKHLRAIVAKFEPVHS